MIQGLLVGVGAGGVGAVGGCLIKFGATQESVLSLLGALIGAVATVACAAWLSDRNSRAEQQAELQMLIYEYENINRKAKDAQALAKGTFADDPNYQTAIHLLASAVWECRAVTQEALETSRKLTFRHRARLRQTELTLNQFWDFYHDKFDRDWAYLTANIIIVTDLALAQFRESEFRLPTRLPIGEATTSKTDI